MTAAPEEFGAAVTAAAWADQALQNYSNVSS